MTATISKTAGDAAAIMRAGELRQMLRVRRDAALGAADRIPGPIAVTQPSFHPDEFAGAMAAHYPLPDKAKEQALRAIQASRLSIAIPPAASVEGTGLPHTPGREGKESALVHEG